MRKKILVMPDFNWLAHTTRPFEIAIVLRNMGYDVLFAGEGYYMKLPREKGFQIIPLKTMEPNHALTCVRSGRVNFFDYDMIKDYVDEELKLFDQIKPDLILTDFRLTLSTSCEIADIPLAVTLNASWTNYYDVRIRAVEHIRITQIIGKRFANWIAPWTKSFVITYDSLSFRRFRREKGLNLRRNIWEIWRGDLNLIVDIPEYGPTKNLPSDFHYIGPIIWEPEMEAPEWLEMLDPERPTLYFTMGSTGHAKFFEQAIEIFGSTRYQCIMTTAGMADLSYVPDNFFVVDYAPGSKIMEKSDLVICQGGNGTIYQAMSKGVPIIGIPTMHDQEFNLQRVEDLGIGIHLSELKFKPFHLEEAVEQVLARESYKENARKYEEILKKYNGSQKGAELIDSYLAHF
ncbi:MAG: glycosyltransferase [Bacteroidetes bacterium]|nr:glycosyltransferase [Bacteroidota bacterium]